MRAILTVFAKEFRENLRDRRTVISALLFGPLFGPLLFAAALAFMVQRGATQGDRPVELAVAHADRAPRLVEFLVQRGVQVEHVDYDEEQARAAVRERRERLVLSIPDDFAGRFAAAQPAAVLLYLDSSDPQRGPEAQRVRALIAQYGGQLARLRVLARGIDPLVLTPVTVQDVDVSTPASRALLTLGALSYIVLLTMLTGGLYLSIDATAGERERGSLEPLLTVPVPRAHLIYGKILAACAYMLLSLVLTVAAFVVALRFVGLERFGMSVNFGPLTALAVVACCAPLIPLGAALMTIVAAFTRSYREAQTYLGLLLLVPTLPLLYAGVTGARPTTALMLVPSLSQHFLVTSLLRDDAIPVLHVVLSAGVTLALGVLLAAFAGRLYRREALLG